MNPLCGSRWGGASGTFETALEAADEAPIGLPLLLGLAVVDEASLMQAALDHCRVFLERIDYGDNVEYVAARPGHTARLQAIEPAQRNCLEPAPG